MQVPLHLEEKLDQNTAWLKFVKKKDIYFDPIFNSYFLNKFMNHFIKKGLRQKLHNTFFEIFSNEFHKNYSFYFIFFESLEKFRPVLKLISYKYRKEIYKLPTQITTKSSYLLALRYYYKYVMSEEFERTFHFKLRNQLMFIFFTQRLKVPDLDNIKKHALNNRMFIHYRWKSYYKT